MLGVFAHAWAGNDKRAQAEELFARAKTLVHGGEPETTPYRLAGHFRLLFDKPVEGTYLFIVSAAPNTWRLEISFPGFSEVAVRNGDGKWVRRNADRMPERVRQLTSNRIPNWALAPKDKVSKIAEETVAGVAAICVLSQRQLTVREHCFDKQTGLPLREQSLGSGPSEIVEYGDYIAALDRQIPRTVRVTEKGSRVVEFWVDSITTQPVDDSIFAPLQDASYWPVCDHMKAPVPIHTPDPLYPEADRRNRVQGSVELQLVIDAKGRTHDIAVTRSVNPRLDREAKVAVSKWRFHPAMCGNTFVPTEMLVEVDFRLY